MISELNKVQAVLRAYKSAIEVSRGTKYVRLSWPEEGTKQRQNCLDFYEMCDRWGISIGAMMLASLDRFPKDWCAKKFGRPHPPAGMVLCANSRAHALKNFPLTLTKNVEPNRQAELYANQLASFPKDKAIQFINTGMFDLEPNLKQKVVALLQR